MAGGGGGGEGAGYVAPPSTGHELGVLFGFLGLMLICMLVYGVGWQIGNKRSLQREEDRIARLRAAGHLRDEKAGVNQQHGA